ncbi:glycosyltransferase family 2 protein [Candidatus Woesearchaeota archaeon]|nr:glycosyltransferase family 2 protein [Candidatus Woesearchaeota archaeon]
MEQGAWIVIAAYNEEHAIGKVVDGLKEAGYQNVVVVDDGSRDKTFQMAEQHGAQALRHIINRGQGASLKTGIDFALQQGAEFIVTFDADGQHRVEDLPAMLKPVVDGKADIALGSRFLKGKAGVPFVRKLFLKGGIFFIWLLYGVKMTDAHNGFRAMSRHAAQTIELRADRMEHASEFIDEIRKKQLRYKEVPVVIKYTEYSKKHGQSSWNAFRILYKMLLHKFMR